ncbi:MAG: bifunctional 4-hydroxy-2-oxoglutarate aldolase/2-dehydro-3-deoxy-phosphogluconate aldolase [Clostridia bacterium]|nr:bifunctional 4-hydroxy-2-oxoglutarate aldolase/2-dehydro-3-deoxy-phosphogluconate aldolase [Clostridia bacterium]
MSVLECIGKSKIIAISRGFYGEELIKAASALYDGGIRAFEVTFEQDKIVGRSSEALARTCDAIIRLSETLPEDAVIGAGTVMDVEQVRLAHDAGAGFIISPNTDDSVIEKTKHLGMVSIPGAMTPTEIVHAHSCGADIVKLFPAGVLGPEYFKAIKAPLAHIAIAAVAGIDKRNIALFERAGAAAYGVSSTLFIPSAIRAGDFRRLTGSAEELIAAVRS